MPDIPGVLWRLIVAGWRRITSSGLAFQEKNQAKLLPDATKPEAGQVQGSACWLPPLRVAQECGGCVEPSLQCQWTWKNGPRRLVLSASAPASCIGAGVLRGVGDLTRRKAGRIAAVLSRIGIDLIRLRSKLGSFCTGGRAVDIV